MGITATVTKDKPVHVGSDIWAPPRITVEVVDVPDVAVDLTAELRLDGGRYEVEELRIRRREGGMAVTGEVIRSIPVQSLVRGAVANLTELRTGAFRRPVALTIEDGAKLAAAGPTDETLRWVARLYLMAQLASEAPAKAVKEALDIPSSTAGLWIRRSKDRGYMDAKEPPRSTMTVAEADELFGTKETK